MSLAFSLPLKAANKLAAAAVARADLRDTHSINPLEVEKRIHTQLAKNLLSHIAGTSRKPNNFQAHTHEYSRYSPGEIKLLDRGEDHTSDNGDEAKPLGFNDDVRPFVL